MQKIRIFCDKQGNTLNAWFNEHEKEYICRKEVSMSFTKLTLSYVRFFASLRMTEGKGVIMTSSEGLPLLSSV